MQTEMRIIKRNGEEVMYDGNKIFIAVSKANAEVDAVHRLSDVQIQAIVNNITQKLATLGHTANVEEIQDMVETAIMEMRGYEVAQTYVRYRYKREIARKNNTTDENILSIINLSNEEAKQENSNKDPVINSTQRDYIAGEVSKDITMRLLLPEDIVKAHEEHPCKIVLRSRSEVNEMNDDRSQRHKDVRQNIGCHDIVFFCPCLLLYTFVIDDIADNEIKIFSRNIV